MAKLRRRSRTIQDNTVIIVLTAVSGGILAYSDDLRALLPAWAYVPLVIACSAYNIWRRCQTSEPLE